MVVSTKSAALSGLNVHEISIEGLPMIGRGANGAIYRLDEDKIVKVYNPATNTLDRIQMEKKSAKTAFIHDIPSAISYNIIKAGDRYGIIYEFINAQTLGQYITNNPEQLEEYGKKMADLLKKLHSTEFEPGVLPDARENLQVWADIAEKSGYYSDAGLLDKCIEVKKILISSINTAKSKQS